MIPIKLDLTRDLAKVTDETLAEPGTCYYTAPCAVGAMMTPEQRTFLKDRGNDSTGVVMLIDENLLEVPDDQLDDFRLLQSEFDDGDFSESASERFFKTLATLKTKYASA